MTDTEPDGPSPIRPTDGEARSLGRGLIDDARFAALGVRDPESGAPIVSRIAVATDDRGAPVTLISELSHHTRALRTDPVCSLLLGEPGDRGDPLTHPRITVQARAVFLARGTPETVALRTRWLDLRPKSALYADFGDFNFVCFEVTGAYLNGGFGKAFVLTPEDLGLS